MLSCSGREGTSNGSDCERVMSYGSENEVTASDGSDGKRTASDSPGSEDVFDREESCINKLSIKDEFALSGVPKAISSSELPLTVNESLPQSDD